MIRLECKVVFQVSVIICVGKTISKEFLCVLIRTHIFSYINIQWFVTLDFDQIKTRLQDGAKHLFVTN